jgi:hypothetical protein
VPATHDPWWPPALRGSAARGRIADERSPAPGIWKGAAMLVRAGDRELPTVLRVESAARRRARLAGSEELG